MKNLNYIREIEIIRFMNDKYNTLFRYIMFLMHMDFLSKSFLYTILRSDQIMRRLN